jgi:RimJ/RimL family protein N-acetyltransferase
VLEPVVLRGPVVVLEPLGPQHLDGLVAAAAEDRATYGYTKVPDGAAAMAAYVDAALADHAAGTALPFAITLAGEGGGRVVGTTRLLDLDVLDAPRWPPGSGGGVPEGRVPDVGEVGSTWLAASVQRSAVNTAAKRLVLGHAFDTWGVLRITLKTDARNARSRAAIERLGARFEGIRRAHVLATDGTVRDSAYFSILRDEWPGVRAHLDGLLSRRDGASRYGRPVV